MEMKHTPGPWSVPHLAVDSTSCNCAYVLAEPYMGSICTISVSDGKTISELGNDSPPLEEAKANARLIAAAPDLLAALTKARESVHANCDALYEGHYAPQIGDVPLKDKPIIEAEDAVLAQIDAAIAKATGAA
jgi:hypothetical protein